MREEELHLSLGFPVRLVALEDRGLGLYEHEVQADIGFGFQRVLSWNPKHAEFASADEAFETARTIAMKTTPSFFGPWIARETARRALEGAARLEEEARKAEHRAAAPLREAYVAHGQAELARRADAKAAAHEARAKRGA